MRKTGFIAIVGLANAGKSTLLNALIQQKVSIVSPKPQTTRDSIMGVWTDDESQIVFVDTPGFLQSKNALGDYMLKKYRQCSGRRGLHHGSGGWSRWHFRARN